MVSNSSPLAERCSSKYALFCSVAVSQLRWFANCTVMPVNDTSLTGRGLATSVEPNVKICSLKFDVFADIKSPWSCVWPLEKFVPPLLSQNDVASFHTITFSASRSDELIDTSLSTPQLKPILAFAPD